MMRRGDSASVVVSTWALWAVTSASSELSPADQAAFVAALRPRLGFHSVLIPAAACLLTHHSTPLGPLHQEVRNCFNESKMGSTRLVKALHSRGIPTLSPKMTMTQENEMVIQSIFCEHTKIHYTGVVLGILSSEMVHSQAMTSRLSCEVTCQRAFPPHPPGQQHPPKEMDHVLRSEALESPSCRRHAHDQHDKKQHSKPRVANREIANLSPTALGLHAAVPQISVTSDVKNGLQPLSVAPAPTIHRFHGPHQDSPKTLLSMISWLVFLETEDELQALLESRSVGCDCRLVVLSAADGAVTEVYRAEDGVVLATVRLGWWDGHRLHWRARGRFERASDLRGANLSCITVDNWPFTMVVKDSSGLLEIRGFIADMWNILQHHLNINTNCTFDEEITDADFEDHFERRKVDIGLTGVIASSLMKRKSSLTTKVGSTSIFLVTRQPGPQSIHWSGFLRPFSAPLWFSLLAVAALLLAALCPLCRLDPQPGAHFALIAAFLQQASPQTGRRWWLRVLLLCAHVTTVVLWSGYSASLVSCLAGFDEWTVADYWTMAESGEYTLHLVRKFKEAEMLKDFDLGPTGERIRIGMKGFSMEFHQIHYEALAAVCADYRGVALVQREQAEAVWRAAPCHLVQVPRSRLRADVGILMAKDSPYLPIVNYFINKMRLAGLQTKRPWLLQLRDRPEPSGVQYEGVALKNVSALLCLYLAAVAVSLLLLLAERCHVTRHRRRRPVAVAHTLRQTFK